MNFTFNPTQQPAKTGPQVRNGQVQKYPPAKFPRAAKQAIGYNYKKAAKNGQRPPYPNQQDQGRVVPVNVYGEGGLRHV